LATDTNYWPNTTFCQTGNGPSSLPFPSVAGTEQAWTCQGLNGGKTATCKATKQDYSYVTPASGALINGLTNAGLGFEWSPPLRNVVLTISDPATNTVLFTKNIAVGAYINLNAGSSSDSSGFLLGPIFNSHQSLCWGIVQNGTYLKNPICWTNTAYVAN